MNWAISSASSSPTSLVRGRMIANLQLSNLILNVEFLTLREVSFWAADLNISKRYIWLSVVLENMLAILIEEYTSHQRNHKKAWFSFSTGKLSLWLGRVRMLFKILLHSVEVLKSLWKLVFHFSEWRGSCWRKRLIWLMKSPFCYLLYSFFVFSFALLQLTSPVSSCCLLKDLLSGFCQYRHSSHMHPYIPVVGTLYDWWFWRLFNYKIKFMDS